MEEEVRGGDLRSEAAGARVWLWTDERLRRNDGAATSAATEGGGGGLADDGAADDSSVEKSHWKCSFLHHHRDIYRVCVLERERESRWW